MKKGIILFFVLAAAGVAIAEDFKIGYVNSQEIFAKSQEYQEAQAKFDKDVENWNNEAEEMRQSIANLQKDLESQSLILSAEKKKEKEQLLAAKQDTLNQFLNATFGQDGKAERRMAELSKPIRDKILEIIEKIAIENNYSLILDAGTVNIAYAKKSLDITDDVLAEMAAEK
ncbi:MAG: OmpH family outer membrane protein [candidate division Zixibacteria bacterium]|jgi:outer membrane protein|nr:OmpH family outer membrane protein [candidate division Zixibacteria bacterium]